MTPTTAAVIAVSGAFSRRLPCVDSMRGPPARMNTNDGRNVKKVTTHAAAMPVASGDAASACVQPPTNPTNATTMMSGPGVVSPSASPSIICGAVSQWNCSTAPWKTYGRTAYAPPNVSSAAFVKNQPIGARTPCQPVAIVSAASATAQSARPMPAVTSRRRVVNRACGGVGVSSSMIARAGCGFVLLPCAELPPSPVSRLPAATPAIAAATMISGKGTSRSAMPTKAAAAMAHRPGAFSVREPMRWAACSTIATTAGLIPSRMPATSGSEPKRTYNHDSATSRTSDGSTKSPPATSPPRVRCMSQPM